MNIDTTAHDSEAYALPTSDPVAATHAVAPIHTAEALVLPTSHGVFKPVGHVMIGLPTQAQANTLVAALHGAGWSGSDVRQFSPVESGAEFRAMFDNAGPLASLGYEITLLQRYIDLTEAGYRWLLVHAEEGERAMQAAEAAKQCGATQAVYYRALIVEELIP
jgi:hypothetical protein